MKKKKKGTIVGYIEGTKGTFAPVDAIGENKPRLPAGSYKISYDPMRGQMYYTETDLSHDQLMDLPTPEYDHIMNRFSTFLNPETKKRFQQYGFLYKQSTLMYGKPGTGKTCLVNRIAKMAVTSGAVVIFDPKVKLLPLALEQLAASQPDTTVVVIFEEFEQNVMANEHELLSILDGEIQRDNVIYLCTTNHIELIPARIVRPGRISTLIEVDYPTTEARRFYLEQKIGHETSTQRITEWAKATEGFSIDELKETVLAVQCLGEDLRDIIQRVKNVKKNVASFQKVNQKNEQQKVLEWQLAQNPVYQHMLQVTSSGGA